MLHDKMANQINHFQHKLSFKLVSENQAIRDINAAINIKKFALIDKNLIGI